jgi:hypothetical protein
MYFSTKDNARTLNNELYINIYINFYLLSVLSSSVSFSIDIHVVLCVVVNVSVVAVVALSTKVGDVDDTQVARDRFPVPARPTFCVEKVSLFCKPASGGTFWGTAINIKKWVKKIAVAHVKMCHNLRPRNTAFKENSLSLLVVLKDIIEENMQ